LLFFLLLACTDHAAPALAACQAVPGLATDALGQSLLQPLVLAEEAELLAAAVPTRGLEIVGAPGLAEIRAQTTCSLVEVNSAGSGQWEVKISRTQPVVSAAGELGALETSELVWHVLSRDGARVNTGLAVASHMRHSLDEAGDDLQRVASSWHALQRSYQDPLLSVDIAEAEQALELWRYRKEVSTTFTEVLHRVVYLSAKNEGERAIRDAEIEAIFTVAGEPSTVVVSAGALQPGEEVTLQVPIPEGATGTVKLDTQSVAFP